MVNWKRLKSGQTVDLLLAFQQSTPALSDFLEIELLAALGRMRSGIVYSSACLCQSEVGASHQISCF